MNAAGDWTDACALSELSAEQCRVVEIEGIEVGLVLRAGQPVALLNHCPHFGGPLAHGAVARDEIVCPWHRFRFHLADGRSVTNPKMQATWLPARVANSRVEVDLSAIAP